MRHFAANGCEFVREGAQHTIVRNPANGQETQVPRHREIKFGMVRKICKHLGVPLPSERQPD